MGNVRTVNTMTTMPHQQLKKKWQCEVAGEEIGLLVVLEQFNDSGDLQNVGSTTVTFESTSSREHLLSGERSDVSF